MWEFLSSPIGAGVFFSAIAYMFINGRTALVNKTHDIKEQRSNIGVVLQKQMGLINQLIDLVKSHQQSEQLVHLKVSQDNTTAGLLSAYQQTGTAMSMVQGVAQKFPTLTSGQQYLFLSKEIRNCEGRLEKERLKSNRIVNEFNKYRKRLRVLPVAKLLGYLEEPYLEFDHSNVEPPKKLNMMQTNDDARVEQVLGTGISLPIPTHSSPVQPIVPAALPSSATNSNSLNNHRLLAKRSSPSGTVVFDTAPAELRIRFVGELRNGDSIPVGLGATIGRDAEKARVVLPEPQLSSVHAWLGWSEGKPVFMDLDSTNGSFVNGTQVESQQEVLLKSGDDISLGKTGTVRFMVQLGTATRETNQSTSIEPPPCI